MTPAHLRMRDQAERLLAFKPGVRIAIVADAQLGAEVKEWLPKPPVILGVATPAVSFVLEVPADEYDGLALSRWLTQIGCKAP